jgi:hypothetical protein
LATAVTLTATGCGSDTSSSPSVATTTAVAAPTPAAPHDARTVLAALTAAETHLRGGAVQSEDTDPNDLLGRPNGYLSRASADMPGGDRDGDKYGIERGLVIEVFPTAADADRRSTFIQDTLKSMQILGTEYHYRAGGGAVLVRVSGKVKPSVAKKVEAAVAKL